MLHVQLAKVDAINYFNNIRALAGRQVSQLKLTESDVFNKKKVKLKLCVYVVELESATLVNGHDIGRKN